jgi:hypothetical protein
MSVGELTYIADRGWQSNYLCGCGKPFRECDFWMEVVARIARPSPDQWFARLQYLRDKVYRIKNIPILALACDDRKRILLTSQSIEYIEMLEKVLSAVTSVASVSTIVDSSKDPPYGFFLANCKGVNLYPAHLIRDPRAVAFSRQRIMIRPDNYRTTELMTRLTPRQTAFQWTLINSLIQLLGRITGRYFRIRYEDIVLDPEQALRRLLDWVGLDSSVLGRESTGRNSGSEHELSGNPMRFQSDFKITPDIQWLHSMSSHDKAIATFISAPLLVRYGYKMVPGDSGL